MISLSPKFSSALCVETAVGGEVIKFYSSVFSGHFTINVLLQNTRFVNSVPDRPSASDVWELTSRTLGGWGVQCSNTESLIIMALAQAWGVPWCNISWVWAYWSAVCVWVRLIALMTAINRLEFNIHFHRTCNVYWCMWYYTLHVPFYVNFNSKNEILIWNFLQDYRQKVNETLAVLICPQLSCNETAAWMFIKIYFLFRSKFRHNNNNKNWGHAVAKLVEALCYYTSLKFAAWWPDEKIYFFSTLLNPSGRTKPWSLLNPLTKMSIEAEK
jgi:hypothetical protein